MLHIVNRAPQAAPALTDCLRVCEAGSGILLIEDGVYAALAEGTWLPRMLERTHNLYVLEADAVARGVANKVAGNVRRVDYAGFVALCAEYPGTYSWY